MYMLGGYYSYSGSRWQANEVQSQRATGALVAMRRRRRGGAIPLKNMEAGYSFFDQWRMALSESEPGM